MALSTKLTRAELRTVVRRELMDPSAKWWSDTELNDALQKWMDRVQEELTPLRGTATVTTGSATLTLTDVASDMAGIGGVWVNDIDCPPASDQEIAEMRRANGTGTETDAVRALYQPDAATVAFYPEPTSTNTIIFEYPKQLTFSDDVTACPLPAWCRFSARPFVAYKATLKPGPNQDLQRAARYKAAFLRSLKRLRHIQNAFFPSHYPQLRPAGTYEASLLKP